MRATSECRWLTMPAMVTRELRAELAACWREVANAGGAVGFPFLPVSDDQVRAALDAVVESLDPQFTRLLVASSAGEVAGWLLLSGNSSPLTAHWARVLRVQTALAHRRAGIGRMLMEEAARSAREDLALDQLHLELRSGLGLEAFYQALGWREIGRWPAALRLPEDDRDEVLMFLPLR
jgi:predicted N-acetyltransferase YhbS